MRVPYADSRLCPGFRTLWYSRNNIASLYLLYGAVKSWHSYLNLKIEKLHRLSNCSSYAAPSMLEQIHPRDTSNDEVENVVGLSHGIRKMTYAKGEGRGNRGFCLHGKVHIDIVIR